MNPFQRVVVLFGGASGERRVSVASAQHVCAALEGAEPWFVAADDRVYRCARDVLARHERPFETDFDPSTSPAYSTLDDALDGPAAREAVFFLGFHGGAGEDGTVQAKLEKRSLPFTGSGSLASARAFDKAEAKRVVQAAGVAVAESLAVPRGSERAASDAVRELLARHGRVVVKPIADGSSVGLYHVRAEGDVARAARGAVESGVAYLAEAFVEGPELTIGVVDDARGTRALPASEVRLDPGRVFDFEGKYLGRGTVELTPAEQPEAVTRAARDLAVTAHRALGCEGYSRTDVIAGPRGPVFLETNTLPGLTRASFLPQQLAAEGTSMRAFLEAQVALALARAKR